MMSYQTTTKWLHVINKGTENQKNKKKNVYTQITNNLFFIYQKNEKIKLSENSNAIKILIFYVYMRWKKFVK